MNFTSQICTSRSQSERLLALGLKKETADMHHYQYIEGGRWDIAARPSFAGYNNRLVPAWSLHRLIEIADTYIEFSPFAGVNFQDGSFSTNRDNDYDAIIDIVEWLIQKEQINKEYLEE